MHEFLKTDGHKILGRGNATVIVDTHNRVLFEGHTELSFITGELDCFGTGFVTESYFWKDIVSADIFGEVVRVTVDLE